MKAALPGWAEPLLKPARYKSVRGGRGSSKSHTFAQMAVLLTSNRLHAHGYPVKAWRMICARDFTAATHDSVQQAIIHYIDVYRLSNEFHVGAGGINHLPSGSRIMFYGTHIHPDQFKSIEGIDVIWFEQAERLTADLMNVILPSIRKDTAELWFSWNPQARTDWVWRRFVSQPRPGDVSLEVNWRHNPWWSDTGLDQLRRDTEEYEPESYAWIWEGHPADEHGLNAVLPYKMLRACVTAHEAGLAPPMAGHAVTYAGLDLAEGGADKCALAIRHGPTVVLLNQWPGVLGDLSAAAAKAKDLCAGHRIVRIYYDAASPAKTDLVRAGFKGIRPVNFGGAVGGPNTLWEPRRPNAAVFSRRNMQMAATLRLRAERTMRLLAGDATVNPETCLFIPADLPNLEEVLAELSQPKRRLNITNGKWELEKDPDRNRSPDRFDALCLAYAVETDNRGLKHR